MVLLNYKMSVKKVNPHVLSDFKILKHRKTRETVLLTILSRHEVVNGALLLMYCIHNTVHKIHGIVFA